jgi:hypothetical protein
LVRFGANHKAKVWHHQGAKAGLFRARFLHYAAAIATHSRIINFEILEGQRTQGSGAVAWSGEQTEPQEKRLGYFVGSGTLKLTAFIERVAPVIIQLQIIPDTVVEFSIIDREIYCIKPKF